MRLRWSHEASLIFLGMTSSTWFLLGYGRPGIAEFALPSALAVASVLVCASQRQGFRGDSGAPSLLSTVLIGLSDSSRACILGSVPAPGRGIPNEGARRIRVRASSLAVPRSGLPPALLLRTSESSLGNRCAASLPNTALQLTGASLVAVRRPRPASAQLVVDSGGRRSTLGRKHGRPQLSALPLGGSCGNPWGFRGIESLMRRALWLLPMALLALLWLLPSYLLVGGATIVLVERSYWLAASFFVVWFGASICYLAGLRWLARKIGTRSQRVARC